MIIRIVKLTIKKDFSGDFIDKFKEIKARISDFEGCSHLELLSDVDKSGVFFTYSHWDNENSLENYRSSPFFNGTWNTVKSMFAGKPEAWSLSQFNENHNKN
jgi:quinol monooxygenase YgiN